MRYFIWLLNSVAAILVGKILGSIAGTLYVLIKLTYF